MTMNYPLFERSDGFYHALALVPDWDERLVRLLDMEELAAAQLDEAERVILHLHQLGYSTREIAWHYGTSQSGLSRKVRRIFERLADASIRADMLKEAA
ncbi:MAG: hypothetical protein WCX65_16610 [bacterium]